MIVNALQKQTKQYITSCSGVDVKEVKVYVDTSANMGLKSKGEMKSEIAADADAAEKAGRMVDRLNDAVQKAIQSDAPPQPVPEKKEALHQRIFRKKEDAETAEEPAADKAEEPMDSQAKPAKTAKKKAEAIGDPHDKEDAL